MIRPFLGQLLSQSMQIEELLDAYDAGNSCRWCSFRSLTAAMKLFSDVSYELLHIQHSLHAYRLLPIERDFVKATEEALDFTGDILLRAGKQMIDRSGQLGHLQISNVVGAYRVATKALIADKGIGPAFGYRNDSLLRRFKQ